MFPRSARPVMAILAGLALVSVGACLFASGDIMLEVVTIQDNRVLFTSLMRPGDQFTIRYNHSVNQMPIWEVHSVDSKGRIFIEEERFVSFNAGMGHWAGHGRHVNRDGIQVLEDIHKPIGDFILRVGAQKVGHTLIVNHRGTNLSERAEGKAVRFSARRLNLLKTYWLKLFHHPNR